MFRESDVKGGSFIFFAFEPDRTAMGFDDLLADGQTQAEGFLSCGAPPLFVRKHVEDMVAEFCRDTDSLISYLQNNITLTISNANVNLRARRTEFDGIADQVIHYS